MSADTSGARYNMSMTALLVGIPVLVGASCYYIYSANRNRKQVGGSDNGKDAQAAPAKELSLQEQIMQIKQAGNLNYSQKNYALAIELYTKAIEMGELAEEGVVKPDDLGIFYQNRAACHEALAEYARVLDDCTLALKNKRHYIKALIRRAKAYEKLGRLEEALVDAYAACLLDKFSNQANMSLVDGIASALSAAKAKEALKTHRFDWPSRRTIRNHFAHLTNDPIKEALGAGQPVQSEEQLEPLLEAASREENKLDPRSMIVRATCHQLKGDLAAAQELLDQILALDDTNPDCRPFKSIALVRKSNMIIESFSGPKQVEEKEVQEVQENLRRAMELDPNNSDVFLPMAQTLGATEKIEEAIEFLDRAISIKPDFYPAIAQKTYLEIKKAIRDSEPGARIKELMEGLKQKLEEHPESQDLHQIYAQILTEMNDFEQADQVLVRLAEREPNDGSICISRAMIQLHIKNNPEGMVALLEEAIKKDPKLIFAYELLGSIKSQEGKVDEAIKIFETALQHATLESDYVRCYGMLCPALSHKTAAEQLGL